MLLRHSSIYVVSRVFGGLLTVLSTALLTRLLAPAEYGVYALAAVGMTLAANICFDWLVLAFARFGQNAENADKVAATVVTIFVLLGAFVMAISVIAHMALPPGPARAVAVVGAFQACAMSWSELGARYLTIKFRPGRYFITYVVRGVLVLAFALAAAWTTRDPVLVAFAAGVGFAVSALASGFPGAALKRARFDPATARNLISFGLPFLASLSIEGVSLNGARLAVQILGSEALGQYNAAFLLVQNTLIFFAAGIGAASYPLALKAYESGGQGALIHQLRANGALLVAIMAPAALGLALTAPSMAATLVGREFSEQVALLTPWMALGAFAGAIKGSYVEAVFQLGRKMHLQILISCLNAVVTLLLVVLFMQRYGAVGAAMAVACGNVGMCVVAYFASRRILPTPIPWGDVARTMLACLGMAAVVRLVPAGGPPQFALQVALGVLGYGAIALALNLLGLRSRAARLLRPAA